MCHNSVAMQSDMQNSNDSVATQKKTLQLTEEQKKAARVVDNAVVVAGAGSGKTTVLAMRVVYLMLSKKVPLSQILVLTFTIKASAEMHARIRKQILQAIETRSHIGVALSKEDVDFLEEQLSHYIDAQISTIDSFCLRIANIAANRLGYMGRIHYSAHYNKELRDFVFRWIFKQKKNSEAIVEIVSIMDIDEVISDYIFPALQNLNAEHREKFFDVNAIFEQCKNRVQHMLHGFHADIIEKISYLNDVFKRVIEEDDAEPVKKRVNAFFSIYEAVSQKEWSEVDASFVVEQLGNIDFRGNFGKLVSAKEKDMFKACKELIFESKRIEDLLKHEVHVPHVYTLLYTVIQQLAQDWIVYRKQNVLFSFSDIANLASTVLDDYPDVQQWFASSYRFIIVDEAQDNNFQQKSFLYNLSKRGSEKTQSIHTQKDEMFLEEQKFYFVGDPQQSIYSFRGAEVQSFTAMNNEMQETLYLRHNHRSNHLLIHFFNVVFDSLFNNKDLQLQRHFNPSSVQYQTQLASVVSQDVHAHSESHNETIVPEEYPVVLTLYREEEEASHTLSSKELEAYDIARNIQSLWKEKKYAYEDIAVLSKNKNMFPYLLKYFTILSIPYSINEAGMGLRMDIGFDFYAWFSLLLYPEDRSAYAAVLRSPLANISDSVVLSLLLENNDMFTIPQELQEDLQYAQAIQHVHVLRERYNEAKKLLKGGVAVDILDDFWLRCGYRYTILAYPNYHSFLDTYYVLRSFLQQQQEGGGIVHTHTMLRNNLDVYNGVSSHTIPISDVSTQGSGVQIMTIHASKGLEFPVVFVMGLGSKIFPPSKHKVNIHAQQAVMRLPQTLSSVSSASNVSSSEHKKSIVSTHKLLRTNDTSQNDNDIMNTAFLLFDEDRQAGEPLRILYVAMTRAKERLFLSGAYAKPSFFDEGTVKHSTFLDYLQTVLTPLPFTSSSHTRTHGSDHADNRAFDSIHMLVNNSMLSEIEAQAKELLSNQYVHTTSTKKSIDTALQESEVSTEKTRVIEFVTSKSPYYTKQKDYDKSLHLPDLPCEAILKKYKIYSDFGVYCHALISEYISERHIKPEQANRKLARVLATLRDDEQKLFIDTAKELMRKFVTSSFYREFSSDAIKKTESPFLLWNKKHGVWLNGIIDFLVYDKGKVYIVDFKVDSYRYPERHFLQLSSYELAAKKMFPAVEDTDICCYIYYLRNAELVPVMQKKEEDELFDVLVQRKMDSVQEHE